MDVLAIAILGCLCGCDNAEALEDWANKEKSWLEGFLTLAHGIPSQDVFLRVSELGYSLRQLKWRKERDRKQIEEVSRTLLN